MASLNKVTLIGHLGRDAETKFLSSGTSVTSFSLATSYKPKNGDEKTEWHNIEAFGKDKIGEYLTKGKLVGIEGRIQTDSWEDRETGEKRYKTKIVADNILLLSSSKKDSDEVPY
jgi:single-strand DNA-binding protein